MEPPSDRPVEIVDEFGLAEAHDLIAGAVRAALSTHEFGEVAILLTDDERIRRLNREFRGVDAPTDVLTFPDDAPDRLGDIAIAVPYARRQATYRGVGIEQELGYLAIHGALHMMGMDDSTDNERDAMQREMNRIAVCIGLPPDEAWTSVLHEVEP
ncbi:rRNA maturation RNase YbeY [soil metagenome]